MQTIFQKLILILLGASLTLTVLFLAGATSVDQPSQIGRYRMTALMRGNFPDVFVIDTVTGVVKWVGNDEGKPFDQIKGH